MLISLQMEIIENHIKVYKLYVLERNTRYQLLNTIEKWKKKFLKIQQDIENRGIITINLLRKKQIWHSIIQDEFVCY